MDRHELEKLCAAEAAMDDLHKFGMWTRENVPTVPNEDYLIPEKYNNPLVEYWRYAVDDKEKVSYMRRIQERRHKEYLLSHALITDSANVWKDFIGTISNWNIIESNGDLLDLFKEWKHRIVQRMRFNRFGNDTELIVWKEWLFANTGETIPQDYIEEAEHQDGLEYWNLFGTPEDLIFDLRRWKELK